MEAMGHIGNITYSADADITTEPLVLDGGTIRVENGARVLINCETLVINGDVVIDVHGSDGLPGVRGKDNDKGDWMSGQGDQSSRHRQWRAACDDDINHPDDWGHDAQPGTDGGKGGEFRIVYSRIGHSNDLAKITTILHGGAPGAPAPGGLGRILVCGGHGERFKCRDGQEWPGGKPGKDGHVELVRRPS